MSITNDAVSNQHKLALNSDLMERTSKLTSLRQQNIQFIEQLINEDALFNQIIKILPNASILNELQFGNDNKQNNKKIADVGLYDALNRALTLMMIHGRAVVVLDFDDTTKNITDDVLKVNRLNPANENTPITRVFSVTNQFTLKTPIQAIQFANLQTIDSGDIDGNLIAYISIKTKVVENGNEVEKELLFHPSRVLRFEYDNYLQSSTSKHYRQSTTSYAISILSAYLQYSIIQTEMTSAVAGANTKIVNLSTEYINSAKQENEDMQTTLERIVNSFVEKQAKSGVIVNINPNNEYGTTNKAGGTSTSIMPNNTAGLAAINSEIIKNLTACLGVPVSIWMGVQDKGGLTTNTNEIAVFNKRVEMYQNQYLALHIKKIITHLAIKGDWEFRKAMEQTENDKLARLSTIADIFAKLSSQTSPDNAEQLLTKLSQMNIF